MTTFLINFTENYSLTIQGDLATLHVDKLPLDFNLFSYIHNIIPSFYGFSLELPNLGQSTPPNLNLITELNNRILVPFMTNTHDIISGIGRRPNFFYFSYDNLLQFIPFILYPLVLIGQNMYRLLIKLFKFFSTIDYKILLAFIIFNLFPTLVSGLRYEITYNNISNFEYEYRDNSVFARPVPYGLSAPMRPLTSQQLYQLLSQGSRALTNEITTNNALNSTINASPSAAHSLGLGLLNCLISWLIIVVLYLLFVVILKPWFIGLCFKLHDFLVKRGFIPLATYLQHYIDWLEPAMPSRTIATNAFNFIFFYAPILVITGGLSGSSSGHFQDAFSPK